MTGGSAGFRPFSTCRTHPSDSPSLAANSATGTPRPFAPRSAAFRQRCHRSRATRPATV